MASTYSPTLRIELIGDGDQSGIWGQTTNNNLGALIEQAITGVVTITMTDANYTLTNYNGVVDEARNAVIVATGTNSAQRDIIAPLVEKTYTIKNSTTGGYAIRVIGASGSGVVIPNGVTTSVYCDGISFFPMQVNTVGNQTINGNLSVTGTTSLTGALSASTATFSGAISSVSPSFTGTPTAPTAPAGTNTTQIATTAFVTNVASALGTMSTQNANNVNITGGTIGASVSWGAMPAGTVVAFAQAAAPTGWTQITTDGANNRMLRVVNTAGGGTGGSNSPILNNVVAAHTHNFTSGAQSNDHVHGVNGWTGGQNNNHTHSGTTAGNGSHAHGIDGAEVRVANQSGAELVMRGNPPVSNIWNTNTSGFHDHSFTTGGTSNDHAHYIAFNSGGVSAGHTHSGTTDNGSSQTNWTPRYIDIILCSKN